jgi:glycerol-3-phosphate cytidylyltransferase
MIGFTAGCFDLLHAGHVLMLQEAKAVCDYLVVGLHVDPSIEREGKNKPVQSLVERQIQLEAVKYVDKVVVYCIEEELMEILSAHDINIRIIGEEYEDKVYTGKGMTQYVHYNIRNHEYSTTELRKRVMEETYDAT